MNKTFACSLVLLLPALGCAAHTIDFQLEQMDHKEVFFTYLLAGLAHIIPLGLDHILFVLCIFFLNKDLKQILLQASMFTLAHSVTLALAVYGVIKPPAAIVEPLIAASIVFLALENILSTRVRPWRIVTVFLFGLVHGMGFAGALSGLGMPEYDFATALIGFNLGVEAGQLLIILFMYVVFARGMGMRPWYRQRVVLPASVAIALIAGYWTVERLWLS